MQLQTAAFQTRPLREANLPELMALYRQCEDFLALGPRPHASEEMVRADLALTRAEGGEFCGIYTGQPPALAGVLDVIPSNYQGEPEVAFLELLMIGAPYRNLGLGGAVVAALEEALREAGVRVLRAGVQVNNPGAIRFWQRMGFEITGPPRDFEDGTTAMPLEKWLSM